MDKNESVQQDTLTLETLLELYKVADENHRFYVDKRFTIVSLYFPFATLILSGAYLVVESTGPADSNYQVLICVLGFLLTLFLYILENRNWILSNICLRNSEDIGTKINEASNLHYKLGHSHTFELPKTATFLDRWVKKISQHRAVFCLTIILLLYWVALISFAM